MVESMGFESHTSPGLLPITHVMFYLGLALLHSCSFPWKTLHCPTCSPILGFPWQLRLYLHNFTQWPVRVSCKQPNHATDSLHIRAFWTFSPCLYGPITFKCLISIKYLLYEWCWQVLPPQDVALPALTTDEGCLCASWRQSLRRNFSRQLFSRRETLPWHSHFRLSRIISQAAASTVSPLGTFPSLGGEQDISVSWFLTPSQLLLVFLHVFCLLLHSLVHFSSPNCIFLYHSVLSPHLPLCPSK